MKVKNKFWLTICFLMFFSFSKAQNHVHFIVFGGFNTSHLITDFNNTEIISSQAKQYYNLGAAFRFEFAKFLYIQPEVYLTRKGGLEQAFRPDTDLLNQEVDIQSIDMPIMFGLRLFHSDRFAFRTYGGPVVSFLQYQTIKFSQNGQSVPWSAINTKANVFSLQVGAGVDITRFLTFDVRYEYAFSPMFTVADFTTAHKILYFTVGLKLF